ncbi:uncharacterized protein PB18E9.04c [Strongylocentrotus purpuratus]|uniref:Uncharacterized protein n=1 Tax=Strongylocentrotus purpuratus TaxID=7668 RepID=A0A7M7RBE3_STRPU|nr:uncharacterized protein PB18E9.04c [Strongylocentrotus purpuratus]
MDSTSSQLIKPCRVQITDLRKMKNQEDHFREALDESNQQPSTSSGSGEMQPQGACTVLIVPNQESSTTAGTQEGKPSEGTMLMVSEDGWIEGEPKSPKSDNQQSSDDHMSGMESDFDIDENDGEDGDWIPDPGSDSDENDGPNSESKEEESTQSGAIDLDEPLTEETLKKIMEVVYGVSTPNVATLGLLKEQMDERPKLKLKLLKDLQRGHSMFKKRLKYKNVVVKRQLIETPSPVKVHVQKTMPQWAPHQPLTLAKATAHLAAHHSKGESKGSLPDIPPAQPRLPPPPYVYRSIAPKQPLQAACLPQNNGVMNTGLVLSTRPSVAMTSSSVPPGIMNSVPALPTRPSVAMTSNSVPSGIMNSVPALPTRPSVAVTSTPVNPGSNILQDTLKPQTNISFKDMSSPPTRAIFMPENRTVNIPELHPSPAGSLDVLVPVDATGQMKEPFMGIPLDSCNLIFKSDSEEGSPKSNVQSGKDTPSRRSNDENPSVPIQNIKQEGRSSFQSSPLQHLSTQSNAALPSAGVFPNPQSATSAAPGILPTRAPLTAGLLPPGMVPVGLAPASARPSGVFPAHMFPPGSIPAGMVPVALPPDALRFPVPGAHVNCTCPSGSRPPGPPVHSLLHLQQEDLNRLSATGTVSPAINHSSETPDKRNESPLTTNRAESPGIKIASVRSCTSDEDLSDRTSSSSKASAQAGASPSKTATAGMGLLLTVMLPSSAKERYKHKLNPKSTSNPLTADLKEIHKPATKVDLGMVWNEISLLRTEIQTIKTKVASDIHNIRTDMEEFVKLVGARLGITPQIPVTQQNETVQESEGGNDGRRKRKAEEGELEEQNLKKQAKKSSDYLL